MDGNSMTNKQIILDRLFLLEGSIIGNITLGLIDPDDRRKSMILNSIMIRFNELKDELKKLPEGILE